MKLVRNVHKNVKRGGAQYHIIKCSFSSKMLPFRCIGPYFKPLDDCFINDFNYLCHRCEAYKCILEVLNNLYEKSIEHPHPIPMEAGPPVQVDPSVLTAEQAKFLVSNSSTEWVKQGFRVFDRQ